MLDSRQHSWGHIQGAAMIDQSNVVTGLFQRQGAAVFGLRRRSARVVPFPGRRSRGELAFERLLDRAMDEVWPGGRDTQAEVGAVAGRWRGLSA